MIINKQRQSGATLISWLVGALILGFLGITGIKLVPVYLQYYTIQGIVDELAANPGIKRANKRILRTAIEKRLDVNMLDNQLSSKNFAFERIKGTKNSRKIRVIYDIQKPWFANLDFIAKFNYAKEVGID